MLESFWPAWSGDKEIWYEWLSIQGLADYTYMNNAHIYNTYWYEKHYAETSYHLQWSHQDVIVCARFCSASYTFIKIKVSTHQAAMKNLMHKCICRLDKMANSIIHVLKNPNKSCTLTYTFLRCDTSDAGFYRCILTMVYSSEFILAIVFTVLMTLPIVLWPQA